MRAWRLDRDRRIKVAARAEAQQNKAVLMAFVSLWTYCLSLVVPMLTLVYATGCLPDHR